MGKKRAARLALAKAIDNNNEVLQRKLDDLNQITENLQILLKKETDKRIALETKLEEVSMKANTKKTSKKTAVSEVKTEKE